jgi:hypothetical protein
MNHWRDWKRLADLSSTELRGLACDYRKMAETVTQVLPARALRELAQRCERMAGDRDHAESGKLGASIETLLASDRFTRTPIAFGLSNGAIMGVALLLTGPRLLAEPSWFNRSHRSAMICRSDLMVPVLILDGAKTTTDRWGWSSTGRISRIYSEAEESEWDAEAVR